MRKATLFNVRKNMIQLIVCMMMIGGIGQLQAQDDCPPLTVFCQDLHTSFMPDSFDENDDTQMSQIFQSKNGSSFEVTIWITNPCSGEQTRCLVNLDIQDNTGLCPTQLCPFDPNPWCGFAVVTCSATGTSQGGRIIDTRKNSQAVRGDDWADPSTPGAPAVDFIDVPDFGLNGTGQIFGTALNRDNGDIYVAATDVYAFDFQFAPSVGFPPPTCVGAAGAAGIYSTNFGSVNQVTPIITTLTSYPTAATFNNVIIGASRIPNTGNTIDCDPSVITGDHGNGIGNISYDRNSGHLFASNLEDGRIYSVNVSQNIPTITAWFDPLTSYDTHRNNGLVRQDERVWGLQVSDCGTRSKLFYAVESTSTAFFKPKSIYSVVLNADGTFDPSTEILEFVVPDGMQTKFTDIALNQSCDRMLLAERGHPHKSAVFEYINAGGQWLFNRQYFAGIFDPDDPGQPQGNILGTSATGGVSFGSGESNCVIDNVCDSIAWYTINCGDAVSVPGRCDIYGLEGASTEVGNTLETNGATDIYVSLSPEFTGNPALFKGGIGDVDIFNCCCPHDLGRNVISANGLNIGGNVATALSTGLNDVQINLSGDKLELDIVSDNQGAYVFENILSDDQYMLSAQMDDDPLNGITTLDLIHIQRHILGLKILDHPAKLIAADINRSGQISSSDLVELRRLILGFADGFTNNEPWNFVPTNRLYSIPRERLLHEIESLIMLEEVNLNHINNNFTGIKTGDVTFDNSYELSGQNRSVSQNVWLYDVVSTEGSKTLNIYPSEDIAAYGFQIALEIEGGISEVSSDLTGFGDGSYSIKDGILLVSWSSLGAELISKDDPILSIDIISTELSSGPSLSKSMRPELYDENLLSQPISLTEMSKVFDNQMTIVPNPVQNSAVIIYNSDVAIESSLEVYRTDGVQVYIKAVSLNKGVNEIRLNTADFSELNSGIYFARIRSGEEYNVRQFSIMK